MNPTAQEIPKDAWPTYFGDFAQQHAGWGVTLELLDPELGDQTATDGLPLQGISFETKGSRCGDMMIEVGEAGMPFQTHLIPKPKAARVAVTDPGEELDLEIDSGDDGVTRIIHVRRRPELPPPGQA